MKIRILSLLIVAISLGGCFTGSDDDKSDVTNNSEQGNQGGDSGNGSGNNPGNSDGNSDGNEIFYGTLSDITADHKDNQVPYIPPQCYTDPVSDNGDIHNPCYACHNDSKDPNYLDDFDVQLAYSFPEGGTTTNWSNIYKDRTSEIEKISDETILDYVRQDNYKTSDGRIILAEKLKNLPSVWDRDKNGSWGGYIPDVYFDFDGDGFDRSPDGSYTGWRVFAYAPFLGTFMPTNGSTDDVMIRLPETFRETADGEFDLETYKVNMAIVEAMMKKKDITIDEVDENRYGVDLDRNGILGNTTTIKYEWAPLNNVFMSYVGYAKTLFDAGEIKMAAGLFPVNTEFAHTVRYIDVDGDGNTKMAARMKEFRYGKKTAWRNYNDLMVIVNKEIKERHDFPARKKQLSGNMEVGIYVPQGWKYQGFIEDDAGQLRPQTYEETYFCAGCHGYIGADNDTIVSFNRKLEHGAYRNGWYHWLEKGLSGIADRKREDGHGEYAYYLEQNPTGNEYRDNEEVLNKFFDAEGDKKEAAFAALENDISYLLMPSAQRALLLDKAYKVVVDEQSFDEGREAIVKPLDNVHKEVEVDQPTGIKEVLSYY